jgi:hypothetical protein
MLEQRTGIARLYIGQEGDVAGGSVKAIKLVPFAAANVFGEDEGLIRYGIEDGLPDGVGREG